MPDDDTLSVDEEEGVAAGLAPKDSEDVGDPVLVGVTVAVAENDSTLVTVAVLVPVPVDNELVVTVRVCDDETVEEELAGTDGDTEGLAPNESEFDGVPDTDGVCELELDTVVDEVPEPLTVPERVPVFEFVPVGVILVEADVDIESLRLGVSLDVREALAPIVTEAVIEAVPDAVTVAELDFDALPVEEAVGVCVGEDVEEEVGVPEGVACAVIDDVLLGVSGEEGVTEGLAPFEREDVGDKLLVAVNVVVGETESVPVGDDVPVDEGEVEEVLVPVIEPVPDLVMVDVSD